MKLLCKSLFAFASLQCMKPNICNALTTSYSKMLEQVTLDSFNAK